MKVLLYKIKNKGVRLHILLAGILCSVSLVLVTVLGMFIVTKNTSRVLAGELLSKLVRQISLNIDENISQIQSLFMNITVDQNVLDVLEESGRSDGAVSLSDSIMLQDKMMQTHLLRNDIYGLYLFDSMGNAYYNSISPSLRLGYRITDEDWYAGLKDVRSIYILPTSVPQRYLIDKTLVISLVQQMESLETQEPLATIVVDVRLELFDHIMNSLELFSNYSLIILDENGRLIYSNEGTEIAGTRVETLYRHILEEGVLPRETEGSLQLEIEGELMHVEYTTSEKTKWRIFCGANVEKITNISQDIRRVTIRLIIATGAIMAFGLGLCMVRPFRTLNRLEKGMDAVKNGSYDVQIQAGKNDEIGSLCKTFNAMAAHLNYLINTVKRLEQEQQEQLLRAVRLELNALQAQINPHFIYNALETISMMAENNDDEDTQQMAVALGKLLRISVKGNPVVTLNEELEHVRSYLLIHKKRFGEKFKVTIRIEEELGECKVPKLILQPLIENSIHHGLKQQDRNAEIKILGYLRGEDLVLEVSDNGTGMDEKTLQRLKTALQSRQEEVYGEQGIGLSNVNQRIRLRYPGEKYGLRIESRQNAGTTVYVTLPMETE